MLSITRGNKVLIGANVHDPDNSNALLTTLGLATQFKFLIKLNKRDLDGNAIVTKLLDDSYGVMPNAKKYTDYPEAITGVVIEAYSCVSQAKKSFLLSYVYDTDVLTLGDGGPVSISESDGSRFKVIDEVGDYVIVYVTQSRLPLVDTNVTLPVLRTTGGVVIRLDPDDTKNITPKQYFFGLQIDWPYDTQEVDFGTDGIEIKIDTINNVGVGTNGGGGSGSVSNATGTTSTSWIINSGSSTKKLTLDTATQTQSLILNGEKILTTDTPQVIISKTISGSVNSITNIPDAALSANVVLKDLSQTLTNKTLTATSNHISASLIDSGTLADGRLSTGAQTAVTQAHAQQTDVGTTSATFTIDTDDNAVGYVNLTFKNGSNNRTIRVNKTSNDLELQKIDGSYVALTSILTQVVSVSKYVHTQVSPITTWTVNHGLNTNDININVWDDTGFQIIADIAIITTNQVSVSFVNPQSGRVIITG